MLVEIYVRRVRTLIKGGLPVGDALATVPMLWRGKVAERVVVADNADA